MMANNYQHYNFNIFKYLKMIYYRVSKLLGKVPDWPLEKAISGMQEEVENQLDVSQLISRIMQL